MKYTCIMCLFVIRSKYYLLCRNEKSLLCKWYNSIPIVPRRYKPVEIQSRTHFSMRNEIIAIIMETHLRKKQSDKDSRKQEYIRYI